MNGPIPIDRDGRLEIRYYEDGELVTAEYDLADIRYHGPATDSGRYAVELKTGYVANYRNWHTAIEIPS